MSSFRTLRGSRAVPAAILLTCLVGGAVAVVSAANPPVPELPPPGPPVFRLPKLVPWPAGAGPVAPAGYRVQRFASDLDSPRWLHVLGNGDVLVAQSRTETMHGMPPEVIALLTRQGVLGPSANSIVLLRPTRGRVERYTLLDNLNQPFGMLARDGYLYVANTDGLVRFRFQPGETRIVSPAERVIDLPAGRFNNHWTRNVVATPDGSRLLVTVGAGTNVNEEGVEPPDRAAIWEIRPDGSGKRLLATGLRNPVGLAYEPVTGSLWTTVNERDGLGEDVPPDYLAKVVDGAFYGWPYVYFGTYADPVQAKLNPAEVERAQQTARVPDLALGAHSVPLGLHFYRGSAFEDRYRRGAFVARRGGGSRKVFIGFDVVFVPFRDGRPSAPAEPFLTGFIADNGRAEVYGRPVGLAELPDGSLLVADDAGNTIWRVVREKAETVPDTDFAGLELRDQFGNTNSLLRQRGSAVVAVVVSVRRLALIERWERDLSQRVPGIRFLNIADLPDDVPVDAERTAATLRKRVPDGVPVLMDPDRRWATSYALDTELPNLLVFDAEGRLLARFRGRWNDKLAAEVAARVPRPVGEGEAGK
jgi:glucose/arabinose dehydrogenase